MILYYILSGKRGLRRNEKKCKRSMMKRKNETNEKE